MPQGDDVKRKDLLVYFPEVQLKGSMALDLMSNSHFLYEEVKSNLLGKYYSL